MSVRIVTVPALITLASSLNFQLAFLRGKWDSSGQTKPVVQLSTIRATGGMYDSIGIYPCLPGEGVIRCVSLEVLGVTFQKVVIDLCSNLSLIV